MCYTSLKDIDALCKLLPLQWQIADLSLQLVGPTLCVHPPQCGQTRHVISFLLALHTSSWPAGKSPLVPRLTFQLLCIYLTRGPTLYHPVTFFFFFLNGTSGQTIFVGKSAESGCALWHRVKWFASLPFREVTGRHIWLKSSRPPLLSPVAVCPL